MKKLLLSAAVIGAIALPAAAQEVEVFRAASDPLEIRASDLMGMRIYASEAAVEGEEFEGIQEGWEDIGEVGDVVLSRDGMVQAVLVDIGGFLGIGERQVAVSMEALRFVSDSATAEDADDYFLVMNASRAGLEAAPAYVTGEATAEAAAAQTEEAVGDAATATTAAAAGAAGAVAGAAATTAEATGQAVEDTGAAAAGAEVADDLAQADTAEETVEVVTDPAAATTTTEAQVTTTETAEPATEPTTETEIEAQETAEAATTETTTAQVTTTDEAAQPATEATAVEGTTTGEAAAATATTGRTPITREGFLAAAPEALTADLLQGAAVYDANDERVGEISELVVSTDGQITDVVVDVGGFLGIGEKPVAMAMDQIDILQQEGGEELRVYVSGTREELEAMPTYEG